VHYHHDRNFEESRRLVQKSIYYIDKKHSIGTFAKATRPETDPRQKNLWIWYQKADGAKLFKVNGNDTIYAAAQGMRVGLPTPGWVLRLCFDWEDVESVSQETLDSYEDQGVIQNDV
jgi:hypothetical protein